MQGTILIKDAGKELPKELLATAAKLYPTGWGVSVVNEGTFTCQGSVSETGENTSDSLSTLIEDFKDDMVLLYAFKKDGEFDAGELQPYVVFMEGEGDNAVPILSVFITGTLAKFKGNPHTFATKYLIPNIERLFEQAQGVETVSQLLEEMETNSDFQNEVLKEGGEDTILVFHSLLNKPLIVLGKQAETMPHTWGTLYHANGFEAPTMGTKKTLKSTTTNLKSSGAREEPKMTVVPIDPKMSTNDRRAFIHKRLGKLPDNWKEVASILVPYEVAKKWGDLTHKDFQSAQDQLAKEVQADKSTTQPALPLISTADRKKSDEIVKAYKIEDPAKYKELEEKMSLWSDQRGIPLEETFSWQFDLLQKLPDIAVLAFQYRKLLMASYASKKEEKPKKLLKAG